MTVGVVSNEEYGFPWWLVLVDGIAVLILGLLLVTAPGQTSVVATQFIGIYWLIAGILRIISLFLYEGARLWRLLAGIIAILAGLAVIQHPIWSTLIIGSTLIIILGLEGIIYGGIGLYMAFKGGGLGTGILSGVSILIGLALLFNVWVYTFSLPWVIGILAIIGGIASIITAFRLR